MVGKRLALGVLVGGLGLAAVGGFSSSSGQSPETPAPGVSYGGLRDFETVWLRVDESRRVVIALELGVLRQRPAVLGQEGLLEHPVHGRRVLAAIRREAGWDGREDSCRSLQR